MRIAPEERKGRRVWILDNEALRLTWMQGGGHLAALVHREAPNVSPYWIPPWPTMEPWEYVPSRHAKRYDCRLLASIAGHNICFGAFGPPSPEEARAGMSIHGEAPVARWRVLKRVVGRDCLQFVCECLLPIAEMTLQREMAMRRNGSVIRIRETIRNHARRDVPYTMCEHVTFGPPFLEKGVTLFDACATKGHSFPAAFGRPQRLKENAPYQWPIGNGTKGPVDMRMIGREYRRSSDFSTHLMNTKRDDAWFAAANPRRGLLVAYSWKRADFPWLGNWEENYGRRSAPWNGRTLTRGMEFANSPFPLGLRAAAALSKFQGLETIAWLPARSAQIKEYAILALPIETGFKGVADIRRRGSAFEVVGRDTGRVWPVDG